MPVRADGTGDIFVFLSAEEDAALGSHLFTVAVMSGSQLIEELNLRSDVTKGDSSSAVPTGGDFSGFRKGLEVGFIVLLIILVILGIILAIRKMGREESEEGSEGGKTYY